MVDKTASTELEARRPGALAPIRGLELEETWRVAKALSASGFFRDARQAEQAFAKILFGRDLGLTATEAMTSIHIIEGKPELSANLQASRVKSTPGYDYSVDRLDDDGCQITFTYSGVTIGVSTFDRADAVKAGLAGKDVWKKYPRNMFFARTMSNGVAFYCPEVMGGMRVYSEGEVEEAVEVSMIGSPGAEGEDLSYLDATAEPADADASESTVVAVGTLQDLAELSRVDQAIALVESKAPVDEDALAELSGERDALVERMGGSE